MGELCLLNDLGDVKISWDPSNPEEVSRAREMFKSLQDKGHLFFKLAKKPKGWGLILKRKAKKGDQVTSFSKMDGELIVDFCPETEKIVATPPVGGG